MKEKRYGALFNAYPDSLGGTLGDIAAFLARPEAAGAFSGFYILPSLYHSDLDRGFSVIDYDLNEALASEDDLRALREMGIGLKLDFVLNHASVRSPQFSDLLARGDESPYRDFFINWNEFWRGHGEMTEAGYIQPDPALIRDMFFRKPGLPILMVQYPDGRGVPYWNTFYQQVDVDENGRRRYLGQMDLNIRSPLVWAFYADTIKKLAGYGAEIVRLDAFAYAPKEPGARNFMNEPGTWELLDRVAALAEPYGIALLPEIHASYAEGVYRVLAGKGYMIYDFFLPGLILDAFEQKSGAFLARWASEIIASGLRTVNMLGCHDGIPVLDLKGLLPEARIESLIETLVSRGGYVKDLHGAKNVYYQVNAAYYSALGEVDARLLLARAIQVFMPGRPQVWYLDLFAGKNDHEAMRRAGAGGHKEINRTNLSAADVAAGLEKPVVLKQLALLKLRGGCPAFHPEAAIEARAEGDGLFIAWRHGGHEAALRASLAECRYEITIDGARRVDLEP